MNWLLQALPLGLTTGTLALQQAQLTSLLQKQAAAQHKSAKTGVNAAAATSASAPVFSAQMLSLISKQQQQFQQQLQNSLSRVQVSNAVAAAAAAAAVAAQKSSLSSTAAASTASLLTTLSVAKTPVTSSTLAAAIRSAPGGLVGVGGAGITPNINQLLPSECSLGVE